MRCSTGQAKAIQPVEQPVVHPFVSFYLVPVLLWTLSPFVLGYSNMFYDYIRSLRASLGYVSKANSLEVTRIYPREFFIVLVIL